MPIYLCHGNVPSCPALLLLVIGAASLLSRAQGPVPKTQTTPNDDDEIRMRVDGAGKRPLVDFSVREAVRLPGGGMVEDVENKPLV